MTIIILILLFITWSFSFLNAIRILKVPGHYINRKFIIVLPVQQWLEPSIEQNNNNNDKVDIDIDYDDNQDVDTIYENEENEYFNNDLDLNNTYDMEGGGSRYQ